MMALIILSIALLLDRLIGDPDPIWQRMPHPVVVFGKAINVIEKQFNRKRLSDREKRSNGILAIIALLFASIMAGWLIHRLLLHAGVFGIAVEVGIVAVLLAQKSLSDHVRAVATGLRQGGLAGGRQAVAMIVGRDPSSLDEPAVCRAAIETLAENFSDGVVAPAFYYAVFGLPGLFAYKMLNTADSMVGHKTARFLEFGWAAARLDDLANWPAARMSMLLIAAGASITKGAEATKNALTIALTDHGLHRSPNSGWPEAAMAGALNIALAGPRIYAGDRVNEPMLNGAGRAQVSVSDIEDAIKVYQASCTVLNLAVTALAVLAML